MKEDEVLENIKYKPNLKTILKKVKSLRKKIYLKQIENLPSFKVWEVNGNFIRKKICEDFVNLGQHYHFKFIPKNEFWLDQGSSAEKQFYIDHLLVENRLMKKGASYTKSFEIASKVEKKERQKSSFARKLKQFFIKSKSPKKVHKKIFKNINQNLKIWIVNGEAVRDFLDISFAGGSHGYTDNYIPKNEVWLDDSILPNERKFILIHELHERRLMNQKKLTYLEAHKSATKIEDFCRKHPIKINTEFEKEIKLQ